MRHRILRFTTWVSLGMLALTLTIWFIVFAEAMLSG